MIVQGLSRFGTDWSSEELWKSQTNPVPSPMLEPASTETVWPDNFVEVPAGYTPTTAAEPSGPGVLDQAAAFLKNLFGGGAAAAQQQVYVPGGAAPTKSFFQTPGGIAVAVVGGVVVIGMTYYLFKPSSSPVAIYSGRRVRRSR